MTGNNIAAAKKSLRSERRQSKGSFIDIFTPKRACIEFRAKYYNQGTYITKCQGLDVAGALADLAKPTVGCYISRTHP